MRFLITSCLVALFAAGLGAAEPLEVAPEAQALRERLLAWSESLHSFCGEYRLRQSWPGVPEARDAVPMDLKVTYCFEDENRFMRRTEPLDDGGAVTRWYSLYEGEYLFRSDHDYRTREDYTLVALDAEAWPVPAGAYMTPETLFNGDCSRSLAAFMAAGRTTLHDVNGTQVLVHSRPPKSPDRINVWFDDRGRVETFEWGVGIGASPAEIRDVWDGDPFDAFNKYTELNLGQYTDINGVEFPVWARKVWWAYDSAAIDRAVKALKAKEIGPVEFQARTITDAGPGYETTVQYFDLAGTDIRVNQPIPASRFEIEIPRGASIARAGSEDITTYPGPWYRRMLAPLPLAVLAGLILVIGGTAWYIVRRNSPA